MNKSIIFDKKEIRGLINGQQSTYRVSREFWIQFRFKTILTNVKKFFTLFVILYLIFEIGVTIPPGN